MNDEAVKWLREQIEARRRLAGEACPHTDGHWWRRESILYTDGTLAPVGALYAGEPWLDDDDEIAAGEYIVVYDEGSPSQAQFAHIAANDPRDVIARCAAELAILRLHDETSAIASEHEARMRAALGVPADAVASAIASRDYIDGGRELAVLAEVVKELASGYRHRDGYAEHWGDVNHPAGPGVSTS